MPAKIYPNPEPCDKNADPMAAEIDFFLERFQALKQRALSLGFTCLFAVTAYDPLHGVTERCIVQGGDYYARLGILADLQHALQHGE